MYKIRVITRNGMVHISASNKYRIAHAVIDKSDATEYWIKQCKIECIWRLTQYYKPTNKVA